MNIVVCLAVVLLLTVRRCGGEMRLLQIVFHGGHRVQDHTPSRDPYRPFWHSGAGKVALIGMLQLFTLGQRMRRKYGDMVVTPPPQEVELYASERGAPCRSMSQCFMSGFFRPDKDHPPPSDNSWQMLQDNSNYPPTQPLEPELSCPGLQAAASRIYDESDEGHSVIGEYMNLYQFWSANSGMEIKNPTDARELYESLQLEKSLNASLPSWADRFWPELKRQSDIHFAWLAKSPDMQRMAAGPLLGLLINRMEKQIDGLDWKQYYIYSGKNSSLAGLLAMFGAFDGKEPSFGSTLVLELHRFGSAYYVRILYFYSASSKAADAPEVVVLKGCSEYCPFERFRLLTTGMVPVHWQADCGWWKNSGAISRTQMLYPVVLAWLFVTFLMYS